MMMRRAARGRSLCGLLAAAVLVLSHPNPARAQSTTPVVTADTHGGGTLSAEAIERLPTSRDPWSLLQTLPGLVTDGVDVGGSRKGQPINLSGPAVRADQFQFVVDGFTVTDPAGAGTQPTYVDIDAIERIEVTRGAGTVLSGSTGAVITIMTKQGGSDVAGSARYFFSGGPDPAEPGTGGSGQRVMSDTHDVGFDLGGPLVRDRVWFFGGYGRQRVAQQSRELQSRSDGGAERVYEGRASLHQFIGGLRVRPWPSTPLSFGVTRTDRVNASLHSSNPVSADALIDEESDPTTLKFRAGHVFSPRLQVDALYGRITGGYTVTPQDTRQAVLGFDSRFIRGHNGLVADRDVQEARLDLGSTFSAGGWTHQLAFGAGYRDADVRDRDTWIDGVLIAPGSFAVRMPQHEVATTFAFGSGYVQDTLQSGRLTLRAGIRVDGQRATIGESTARFPFAAGAPAVSYENEDGIHWKTVSPRGSVAWALSPGTTVTGGYGRFVEQLTSRRIDVLNPVQLLDFGGAELLSFTDLNVNQSLDTGEPTTFLGYLGPAPGSPSLVVPLSRAGVDLRAPVTDELFAGIEVEPMADTRIGVDWTWRHLSRVIEEYPLVQSGRRAVASDYGSFDLAGFYDATGFGSGQYTATIFDFRPAANPTGGVELANSDRSQDYLGLSAFFHKRLSNRWMLRGHVSWMDWTWSDDPAAGNPTNERTPDDDPGGLVAEPSSVLARDPVYLNSRWTANLTGLYQVAPDRPWAFDVGGQLHARDGFPAPLYRDDFAVSAAVLPFDTFRYPAPVVVDIGVNKPVSVAGLPVVFNAAVFNLFNDEGVQMQELDQVSGFRNAVYETVPPRVFRVGARIGFR